MWNDVEKGFQTAFEMAWEAYREGTVPIGAAILNDDGQVVAAARNQITGKGEGLISNHQLAHAEANAILMLPEAKFPDIRKYTLYTNVEPCPFCFGAIVMGSIRNVKYAQRDPFGGAVDMNGKTEYLANKKITFTGPFKRLEQVSAIMLMCFEYEMQGGSGSGHLTGNYGRYMQKYVTVFNSEAEKGKRLATEGTLRRFAEAGVEFHKVYDFILNI